MIIAREHRARIVLTGGGSAGHVTPNLALVDALRSKGYALAYIGRCAGIEKTLATQRGLVYYGIPAGKLRRYRDLRNVTDVFMVALGFLFALGILVRLRPGCVFSKGGFVSSPVVWAAWVLRIPVVIHESDISPGLANRISLPFASKICYAFNETAAHLPASKAVHTGLPVRAEILAGRRDEGRRICGFDGSLPVLLILGGSLGAQTINGLVIETLDRLTNRFQVCHMCGAGNATAAKSQGYFQIEYAGNELCHLYAMADIVLSRAGATTLFEILALRKPNVLLPVPKSASRGDQILNAESFKRSGYSEVVLQEDLSKESLTNSIFSTYQNRASFIEKMEAARSLDAVGNIVRVVESVAVVSCR